ESANAPSCSTASTYRASIDDPSIKEGCHACEEFLCPVNQPAVELVEIKLVTQWLEVLHRFGGAVVVEGNRQPSSDNQRNDRKRGNYAYNFLFDWECQEISREKCKPTDCRQEREND